jgi:hypothetical protein
MNRKPSNWLARNRDLILKDARTQIGHALEQPTRRAFLQRTLSLGGLSLLTGCALGDEDSVEHALKSISRINDNVRFPSMPTMARTRSAWLMKTVTVWR